VDWPGVGAILKKVGMAHHAPNVHQRAFEASHTTVFAYHAERLIGFGRAISDGVYQAAVYDCAVRPEYQGRGVGRLIMTHLATALKDCNIILYASPGKEGFYRKFGFRRMKTGMAAFRNSESMRTRGFTE
jgi:GNAT superfamily N-acetyltransferase